MPVQVPGHITIFGCDQLNFAVQIFFSSARYANQGDEIYGLLEQREKWHILIFFFW